MESNISKFFRCYTPVIDSIFGYTCNFNKIKSFNRAKTNPDVSESLGNLNLLSQVCDVMDSM